MADKKMALYRILWKKAWASEEGRLEIDLRDEAMARRVRSALYNAIKPAKNGNSDDPDLLDAAANCSVYAETKTKIVIARTDKGADVQAVMRELGITQGEMDEIEGVKSKRELADEELNKQAMEKFKELMEGSQKKEKETSNGVGGQMSEEARARRNRYL